MFDKRREETGAVMDKERSRSLDRQRQGSQRRRDTSDGRRKTSSYERDRSSRYQYNRESERDEHRSRSPHRRYNRESERDEHRSRSPHRRYNRDEYLRNELKRRQRNREEWQRFDDDFIDYYGYMSTPQPYNGPKEDDEYYGYKSSSRPYYDGGMSQSSPAPKYYHGAYNGPKEDDDYYAKHDVNKFDYKHGSSSRGKSSSSVSCPNSNVYILNGSLGQETLAGLFKMILPTNAAAAAAATNYTEGSRRYENTARNIKKDENATRPAPTVKKDVSSPKQELTLKCKTCPKQFDTQYKLKRHEKTHVELPCENCQEKFKTRGQLKTYYIKTHNRELCVICTKSFQSEAYLKRHVLGDHYTVSSVNINHDGARRDAKLYSCLKCSKSNTMELYMERHIINCHVNN